jgi:hypothetical protein
MQVIIRNKTLDILQRSDLKNVAIDVLRTEQKGERTLYFVRLEQPESLGEPWFNDLQVEKIIDV